MVPAKLAKLVDAAASASEWVDYERPLFDWVEHTIGFDVGFCIRDNAIGPFTHGFDAHIASRTAGTMHHYAREYEPLKQEALRQGGAIIDLAFFGRAGLERTRTYRDIIQPHGGRSSLLLFIGTRTQPMATLVLGRTRSNFGSAETNALRAARSLLMVCELAIASRQITSRTAPALSPRERDLVDYLRLGYTNGEIALACGTSFRTVRNQLSHLFQKLEVSTRSEAVARSFEFSSPHSSP